MIYICLGGTKGIYFLYPQQPKLLQHLLKNIQHLQHSTSNAVLPADERVLSLSTRQLPLPLHLEFSPVCVYSVINYDIFPSPSQLLQEFIAQNDFTVYVQGMKVTALLYIYVHLFSYFHQKIFYPIAKCLNTATVDNIFLLENNFIAFRKTPPPQSLCFIPRISSSPLPSSQSLLFLKREIFITTIHREETKTLLLPTL